MVNERTAYSDFQRLVIQEEDGDDGAGQVPRTIDVEVKGELINSCKAGDTALIAGIVSD